ncbi:hypothetical protein F2P81_025738 [Scophthalmus maximus]|nr:hypothetical protein F2P81_025738 [Scophthalmus maximus]
MTALRDTAAVLTAPDVSPSTQQWRTPWRKLFWAAGEANLLSDAAYRARYLDRRTRASPSHDGVSRGLTKRGGKRRESAPPTTGARSARCRHRSAAKAATW